MKNTGIVRRLDQLGRVVLPMELRRTMNIAEKDSLEIFVEGENIVLRKYQPTCIFCGEESDLKQFEEKNICSKCSNKISNLKK